MKETVRVVKCGKCHKFFGWTEKDPKCRLCHAVYGEVEVKPTETTGEIPKYLSLHTGKKGATKTKKESFKIWGDS